MEIEKGLRWVNGGGGGGIGVTSGGGRRGIRGDRWREKKVWVIDGS